MGRARSHHLSTPRAQRYEDIAACEVVRPTTPPGEVWQHLRGRSWARQLQLPEVPALWLVSPVPHCFGFATTTNRAFATRQALAPALYLFVIAMDDDTIEEHFANCGDDSELLTLPDNAALDVGDDTVVTSAVAPDHDDLWADQMVVAFVAGVI